MSLHKKRRSDYYDYPEHVNRQINPFYPNDYDGDAPFNLEGSIKYSSWKKFSKKYPLNAKLLIRLFGERDAIDCHRSMVVISEVKAASLCSFFGSKKITPSRIKPMGDC